MAGRELQRHRSNSIWQKILTGGAAAVFFALVNMVILPGAELDVRAEEPRHVTSLQGLRDAIDDTTCNTVIIDSDMLIEYGTGESAPVLSRTLTINLNGKKITVNGTLVDINNGNLTITDNPVTETVNDVTASKVKYGNQAFYDSNTNTLTYYVTKPELSASDVGVTTESVEEHVVTGTGTITGTKDGHAVFYMVAGSLTIENGMIAGSQSSAVNMIGSSILNVEGGYLCGNNKATTGNGGAIRASGAGSVNMSGGVIAANTAERGGAIFLDSVSMNMTGGIISGNVATGDGGGIFVNGSGNFIMSDAAIPVDKYITNNTSSLSNDYNNRGGGGVVMGGNGTFELNSGYITGNLAASGGGIYAANDSSAKFIMNDGFITANHVVIGEGGGIRVGGGCMADFNAGYITNNETETSEHWGGGGIFIAETASGFAEKVVVKENKAGGFGGGVAGCSTGLIYMSATNAETTGVAIYSNDASGQNLSGGSSAKHDDHSYARRDEVFYTDDKNYQDYFSMLYSQITHIMLGGGNHNWQGSVDGEFVTIAGPPAVISNSVAGLTSKNISDSEKSSAETAAKVFVTGNRAKTHGGGILCNGYMIFGTPPDKITASTRLEVHGSVQYLNWASNPISMTDDQFTFSVAQENSANPAIAGMNYASGDVRFKRRLTFAADGTYEYIVKQTSPDSIIANGKIDRTEYKVTVVTASGTQPVSTIKSPGGSTIEIWMREIDSISVAKRQEGSTEWTPLDAASIKISYKDVQYSHAVAVYLTDGVYSFTNYNLTPPPPTTDDSTGDSQPVAPVEPENQEVITQTAEGELPQTGQNWMSVILLACAGCICLIIGIALKRVEHEWD